VSRCHAIIKCKKDGFYIEDNTSKFGTIILLKEKLRLQALHTMAVQVGRTVISFTIKYMQSEKEKLKSDISKVLDSKNKKVQPTKAIASLPFAEGEADPQGTNYPNINVPMNEENEEEDQMNDN
tara:strand:+ start:1211 stop:1582 length:372 start_codon:yes stop_codon:yes gene_type:complete